MKIQRNYEPSNKDVHRPSTSLGGPICNSSDKNDAKETERTGIKTVRLQGLKTISHRPNIPSYDPLCSETRFDKFSPQGNCLGLPVPVPFPRKADESKESLSFSRLMVSPHDSIDQIDRQRTIRPTSRSPQFCADTTCIAKP